MGYSSEEGDPVRRIQFKKKKKRGRHTSYFELLYLHWNEEV